MLLCIDSYILLAWLKREQQDEALAKGMRDIFLGLESGKYDIIRPDILTEEIPVPITNKHGKDIEKEVREIFGRMSLVPNPPGLRSRVLTVERHLNLNPAAATYVAMAWMTKCRYFCTNDPDILRVAEQFKELSHGPIEIIRPPIPGADLNIQP